MRPIVGKTIKMHDAVIKVALRLIGRNNKNPMMIGIKT